MSLVRALSCFALTLALASCQRELAPLAESSLPPAASIYGEDMHEKTLRLSVGTRFAVELRDTNRVSPLFASPLVRPRVPDGVVRTLSLGATPPSREEALGGPGLLYLFEVVEEGHGSLEIEDAAARVRFRVRVQTPDAGPQPEKRQKAKARRLEDGAP